MTSRRLALALIAIAGLSVAPHAANADMGKAPATQGIIVSFEGGYLFQDGPDVTGYGTGSPGFDRDVSVSPDDGYFLGGFLGYDNGKPYVFNLHRVELAFLYGETDDSVSGSGQIFLSTVDGAINGSGPARARTSIERKTWEGALRFEGDDRINSSSTVTWVFAPFIRGLDEDSRTVISGCCDFIRTSSVDATLYGVFVAAEPETWLTPNVALVGRVGAGVYGYDADGKFRSFEVPAGVFEGSVSDGDSGAGFRGLLGIGLKYRVAAAALLEGFAEADYFSNVPTAHLTSNDPAGGFVSHVQDDDLWELRTGLRLTVGLGN